MGAARSVPALALLIPLVLLQLPTPSLALRFDLQSGHTKCIAEDIRVNAMSVGKYTVVNPNAVEGHQSLPLPESHRVTVRVSPPPSLRPLPLYPFHPQGEREILIFPLFSLAVHADPYVFFLLLSKMMTTT